MNVVKKKQLILATTAVFSLVPITFVIISSNNNNNNNANSNNGIINANANDLCPSINDTTRTKHWAINVTANFPSIDELRQKLPNVYGWGHWRPSATAAAEGCGAAARQRPQRVAIIVPFRERFLHLQALLNNLHQFLQLQQLEYQIVVVNQAFPTAGGQKADRFNRAKLLNVGFVEVHKQFCSSGEQCWDCLVFHDVDLIPENINNTYQCDQNSPKRLISATDEWDNYKYEPGDKAWLGGVVAITPDQFAQANGFSNNYWGWGAEDENLRERFRLTNRSVLFVHGTVGHYKSVELVHKDNDTTNVEMGCVCRQQLMANLSKTWKMDGLSNLNYALLSTTDAVLYTNITVDLRMEESLNRGHPCGSNINGLYDCKNGEIFFHN